MKFIPFYIFIFFFCFQMYGQAHTYDPQVIKINGGSKITNERKLNIVLKPPSKQELMLITNEKYDSTSTWEPYKKKVTWEMNAKEGFKKIYVYFRDKNNIISQYTANITLDTKPPVLNYFGFESGKYTNSLSSILIIESIGASKMKISHKKNFGRATWVNYRSSYRFFLANAQENVEYKVYIKLKDEIGNQSTVESTTVTIDLTPPHSYSMKVAPLLYDKSSNKHYLAINREQFEKNGTQTIHIELDAKGAKYMKLTNHTQFNLERWSFFQKKQTFTIDITDKTTFSYYVSFRDVAQNKTPFLRQNFIIDIDPPYATSFRIARKQYQVDYTNKRLVNLILFGLEADSVIISEYSDFKDAICIPYQTEYSYLLSPEQNEKIVYAQYKDFVGNVSTIFSDTITLDTIPPGYLSLVINDGVYKTESSKLSLKIGATGANFYQVSENKNFSHTSWTRFKHSNVEYTLPSNHSGIRKVYLRFSDIAGNISETIVDSILLDRIPVPVYVDIENGVSAVKSADYKVNINIFAKYATEMMLSDNKNFEGARWIPYRRRHTWQCTSRDGKKPFYIKFKSFTGRESYPIYKEIIIDNTPPQKCQVSINDDLAVQETNILKIKLKASGAASMQYATHNNLDKVHWEPYHNDVIIIKLKRYGPVNIYARFKDHLGNISDVVSSNINLIIRPSECKVDFVAGRSFGNKVDKRVKLNFFARSAQYMMISLDKNFKDGKWESYRKFKMVELTGEDGIKTIFVKFKSYTNTESYPVQISAILDTRPPIKNNVTVKRLKWTERVNEEDVRIQISSMEAVEFQVSENKGFTSNIWKEYTDLPFDYTLKNYSSGNKTIYIRLRDYYKNVTGPILTEVYVEPIQNYPRVIINNGNTFLKNNHIEASFRNVLVGTKMRYDTKPLDNQPWKPYKSTFTWDIPNDDGKFNIYVAYTDSLDKIYELLPIPLTLYSVKPKVVNFRIKGKYCNRKDRIVELIIDGLNVHKMLLSNNPDFKGNTWKRYKRTKQWILSERQGQKTIYLKLGDLAGNETEVHKAQVILDSRAPEVKVFEINKGDDYTTSRNVKLHIDADNAVGILIGNHFSATYKTIWEDFKENINWELDHQEGKKEVYIRLKDAAGNISQVFVDSILLDTQAPVVHKLLINDGNVDVEGSNVTLSMSIDDAKYMRFSNNNNFEGVKWIPYRESYPWELTRKGRQKVFAIFKDAAGNESIPYSDDITVY